MGLVADEGRVGVWGFLRVGQLLSPLLLGDAGERYVSGDSWGCSEKRWA